jgi:hypothetical protein
MTYYTFSVLAKPAQALSDENYSDSDVCDKGERFRWRVVGVTEIDAGE